MKKIRLVLLATGIVAVLYSKKISFTPAQIQKSNTDVTVEASQSQSFADEPVKIDKTLLKEQSAKNKKDSPVKIIIPALGVNLAVKDAKVVKGYWEVFPDTAGFGLGSAYPEDKGNQVIFAHARPGLFLPLKNIKMGDNIYVLTKNKWYIYTVSQIKEVLPSQIEVISPTVDKRLTLYTCSGFADSKRLIVIAGPQV